MIDRGTPEPEELAAQEWFAEQERKSNERLDAGATLLIQVISAILGLLFGVLAFANNPSYLKNQMSQICSMVAVVFLLAALIATVVVIYPKTYKVQQKFDISTIIHIKQQVIRRKQRALQTALWCFVLGIIMFIAVITTLLFG